ncbi:MAG: bacillithiol biosynthesis cysteine-adding enzyme BshC [Ignavibacteriae bacterium]|nr:bacillithiol biosynthesis cysteine-adding enzyme BshC [Ignavibacteriota bacterium]
MINFKDLPRSTEGGFSGLFIDYLNDFRKVQQYFEIDFHSLQNFSSHVERVRAQCKHRSAVVEVLKEQNQRFGASQNTFENIDQLVNDNTVAVVTGQQVGILGGPLYTVYKIITAIKLAKQLNASYPQYKFIPVFWLEGEDHDFEEVNKVGLLNPDHQPIKVEYLVNGKRPDKNVGPVGEIILDGYIQAFFENVQKTLTNSEYKKTLLQFLQESYAQNVTLNQAFASSLNKFFESEGLVFISSNDKRLKHILSPIFQKELQEYPKISQLIIQQSAELEEQYHAQIKTKALNLFLFHKGGRYFIEPRENDFSLKGTRQYFQKEELLRIAAETPELLSPNVALRPICQDTLLPTLAYVAGPSEVAYFAQLKSVYAYFNLTMPIIYPRASATIVEEKLERILEKYQLDLIEFFGHQEKINRKVIDLISEVKIDEMFQETQRRIHDQLNELKFGLNYIDSTLLGPLESTKDKIESYLNVLKEKVVAAQQRKHEIALRQVQKVSNSIFPNKDFQERELSIIYFMNKYGLEFVKWLQHEVHIDQFQHQVIRV